MKEYEKKLKVNNRLEYLNEFESYLLGAINESSDSFISETGEIERWIEGVDKEKLTKDIVEGAKIRRESIKKKLNGQKKTSRID